MWFKEKNLAYRKIIPVEIQEEKVQETIRKSKEAFFLSEQKRLLSFHEFIWSQFRLIKYRWWVCQLAVLFLLWTILVSVQEDYYIQRSMGIIASLFVILSCPRCGRTGCIRAWRLNLPPITPSVGSMPRG